MTGIIIALYVAAYLLAVVDGIREDPRLYLSDDPHLGTRSFARKHPWILVGAVCGIVATILELTR